jgi:predicted dienelactone hydrolase
LAGIQSDIGVEWPRPTGQFPVGTSSWVVIDPAHHDPVFPDRPRQVRVVAWYPANSVNAGRLAPYLREGPRESTGGGLSRVFGRALIDAPPAGRTARPVLIFSHGYRAAASAYTLLLEDLASHGYVVLSVVHPHEAMAATLSDGTVVTAFDERGTPRPIVQDVLNEWQNEDTAMAAVTATADDAQQLRMIREYLATIPHTTAALRRWVDDTRAVIDALTLLRRSAPTPGSAVAHVADLTRLGVFGHAMGGITAGQFCVEDARCRAALNLDGSPQYGTMIDRPLSRPFLMVYSDRAGRVGASEAIYRRSSAVYYRIEARETLLQNFSDVGFWPEPLRPRGTLGPIAPDAALAITRRLVREFFDQELLGRPSQLLAGRSKWAWEQVSVEVHRPSKRR